jgi:hypothetical protein
MVHRYIRRGPSLTVPIRGHRPTVVVHQLRNFFKVLNYGSSADLIWRSKMATETVSKSAFAALCGVSPPCVTGWIRRGKLYGEALVGLPGTRRQIRVARQQLKQTLDPSQRLGANGKVRFNDEPRVNLDGDIRRARLEQLQLANQHARAIAAVEAGRYVRSEDVQREMGKLAGRMLTTFEGSLGEFATAIAAHSDLPARDALHILRTTFRGIRERAAKTESGIAKALPATVEEAA